VVQTDAPLTFTARRLGAPTAMADKSYNDNGGSAFPHYHEKPAMAPPNWNVSDGMSLRDYFAAKAMPAAYSEIARQLGEGELSGFGWDDLARSAYRIADAMLQARAPLPDAERSRPHE
jgi:hypothetical protein